MTTLKSLTSAVNEIYIITELDDEVELNVELSYADVI